MSSVRDLKLAQKEQLDTRADKTIGFPGTIISIDGSVHPQNRQNYCWVIEQGKRANIMQVLNIRTAAVDGLEVWIRESPLPGGELEIWGLFTDHLDLNNSNASNFNLPLHSDNHIWRVEETPPVDPVAIFLPALFMLKCTTDGTMTIIVMEHKYNYRGVSYYFEGQSIDLTSYVPITADRNVVLLVTLNIISGLIDIISGNETLTIAPNDFPSIPDLTIPSAYIRLTTGDTTLTSLNVTDIRDFLTTSQTYMPPADTVGDILLSHDGINYSNGVPISDSYGELILTNDGIIITS